VVEVDTMVFEKKKISFLIALLFLLTAFIGMQTSVIASGEPPVANAGGPYLGEECQSILLNASGSYDPEGDFLTYRWNIDGSWMENGNYPYMEWIWYNDFSGEIILEVSDGTTIVTDTASVTISNMPPQIISVEASTEVDEDADFFLMVNFFDGLLDPRSPTASYDTFTVTFSWDDGATTELSLGAGEFSAGVSHVYEEAGIFQLMIAVIDSNGGEAMAEWTVIVGEIASVEAGLDSVIDEGSMFLSSGFLGDTDSPTYTAIVDYYDDTGAFSLELNPGNTFNLSHRYLDDGVYTVLVMVFNDGMEYGEDTTVVTVNNVPPSFETLSLSPTGSVQPGVHVQLTGMFSDPGVLDTHSVMIDWGDGSSITSTVEVGITEISGSHSYEKAGDYKIVVTVTDDDGGVCSNSMPIVVKSPPSTDGIKGFISSLKIPLGLKISLLSSLEIVPHFLKHHMIRAARNQLKAFVHFVEAQSGKRLTEAQAQTLISTAQSIIQSLNMR
jgi:hypothetical protein